jgi:ribosomal protein S10
MSHRATDRTTHIGLVNTRENLRLAMSFVTRMTFQSGDREALDGVVGDLRETLERKGAQFNGPHSRPTETLSVPMYADVTGDRTLGDWTHTVFTRTIELVGHDTLARQLTERTLPETVHLSVEVTSGGTST